jgi:hypothetical protein
MIILLDIHTDDLSFVSVVYNGYENSFTISKIRPSLPLLNAQSVAESLISANTTRFMKRQSNFPRHNRNMSDIRRSVQRQCHVHHIVSFNEDDSSLLGCAEVAAGKQLTTFQRAVASKTTLFTSRHGIIS